jgi:hypothetical protein
MDNLFANRHDIKLRHADDAIKIMESGLPGMIFTLNDIDRNFFNLKNKILGDTFQKFATYRYPVAVILPRDHPFGERVTELAREHSNHNLIRFCTSIEDAKKWMTETLQAMNRD